MLRRRQRRQLKRVQCILCGVRLQNMNIYGVHFYRNHTMYGRNRQCKTCGQFFADRTFLNAHIREDKCPGAPIVYDRCGGQFFYRGLTSTDMVQLDAVPCLSYNQLIGIGKSDEYYRIISRDDVVIKYSQADLPLGALSKNKYKQRAYVYSEPPMLSRYPLVVVDDAPQSRSELDVVYRSSMSPKVN